MLFSNVFLKDLWSLCIKFCCPSTSSMFKVRIFFFVSFSFVSNSSSLSVFHIYYSFERTVSVFFFDRRKAEAAVYLTSLVVFHGLFCFYVH